MVRHSVHLYAQMKLLSVNPIQNGGWGGRAKSPLPPTSFSPVTSTNVGVRPQNFLIFSFKPFATLL